MKLIKYLLILLVPTTFLIIGTLTLKDYGFNWDEPIHFIRGQAYFRFLTTGKVDYSDLNIYPVKQVESFISSNQNTLSFEEVIGELQKDEKIKRSYFQSDTYPYKDFKKLDEGHPPIGGILAASLNYVLYQRLNVMGDLESHHFAEVVSAFIIILAVAFLTYKKFGVLASVAASFALSFYPLFFSESHFNIKDPMLASFYGLTIIFFYLGVTEKKIYKILLSGVFLGLATGVKFNTIFVPFILGPWYLYYLIKNLLKDKRNFIKNNIFVWISIFTVPILAFIIFYGFWPFLWENTFENISKIVGYYRQIGIGTPGEMATYIKNGWNTYPIIWIIYTTPIPILIFTTLGIIFSLAKIVKGKDFYLLILLWLFIPILRVSWPNAGIYGGVRHIMEYIPALAILSGIGVYFLIMVAPFKKIMTVAILGSLVFVAWEMVKIHPNQNVYFNQLVGGLSGARDKKIPYWGNTYGNVYLQGVEWMNKNAEPNAKLGLAIATMGNLPKQKLRADIDFYNGYWSGTNRKGEYEMEMDFDWFPRNWYSFQYMEVYLNPVYVVEVEGVPLLKIWKNDLEHTKKGYEKEISYFAKRIDYSDYKLLIDMGQEVIVTRLKVEHKSKDCDPINAGHVATSIDNSKWSIETDPLSPQVPPVLDIFDKDTFVFLFPARKARYILVDPRSNNSCLLKQPQIEIRGLE